MLQPANLSLDFPLQQVFHPLLYSLDLLFGDFFLSLSCNTIFLAPIICLSGNLAASLRRYLQRWLL
uniref:Uncharacterized protein n=1 Tax=Aegilops tauschii subsp. strangulata TaxID=200361 RepID=A0A453QBI4_AEGTS